MYRLTLTPPGGRELDITDRLIAGGLGQVKQRIESSDYVVGSFVYDSMRISLVNSDGRFSEGGEHFPHGGGRTHVRLRHTNAATGVTTTAFQGLVEEMSIKEDERRYTVKLEVLSLDSIINKTIIPAGEVRDGITFRNAMFEILNRAPINQFLNIDIANIMPLFDGIVDNGEWFSNRSAKEAMDSLLIAGGCYAYTDRSGNYIVRPRAIPNVAPPAPSRTFYAAHDKRRLTPIILSLRHINSGINRVFNKVRINEQDYSDQNSIDFYGLKDRGTISMPFITSIHTAYNIAQNLVHEFRFAKGEMLIDVLAADVQRLEVGQVLKIDVRKLVTFPGLPALYGQAKYSTAKYGYEKGKIVPRQLVWTIYDKIEAPEKLTAVLKLRQYGRESGDNIVIEDVYNEARYGQGRYTGEGLRYGEAVYDRAIYQDEDD